MSLLSNNLRSLRKKLSLTQEQLSQKTGIKRSLIGSYEEGRAEPKMETMQKLALFYGLTIDELVTKNYEKLPLEKINKKKNKLLKDIEGAGLRVLPIVVDQEDNEGITVVPQPAAAGYLNGYADPEYIGELPQLNLPILPSTGTCRAFQISGDSMLPVNDGHYIIGEYLQNWYHVKTGNTYIVVTKNDGIVYKRLTNKLQSEGKFNLISDNTAYDPFELDMEEVIEIWTAKAWFSFELPGQKHSDQGDVMDMMREMKKEINDMKKKMN